MSCSDPRAPAPAAIPAPIPHLPRDGGPLRRRLVALLAIVALTAAGCGFKLRGLQTYPFDTISVPGVSALSVELQRTIAASSERTKLVAKPSAAEAVVSILGEQQEKVILSLNTQGQVREYQLRYRVQFSVSGQKGINYVPPTSIVLTRDITFNNQVLAKESEEAQLYREMRSDMVQQIVRRLAAAKPIKPETD